MLPVPQCRHGYTRAQVREIMGSRVDEFDRWMYGSTQVLCTGRAYVHETRQYVTDCGVKHGTVTFSSDVARFLAGLPQDD